MKSKKCGCIKRGISLVVAIVMAMGLIACGGKETEETTSNGTAGYVYVPQFQTLDTGEETYINNVEIREGKLYYISYTYDESTQESKNEFICRPLDNLENSEILNLNMETPEGFTSGMGDFTFDKEGNFYVIKHISPIYIEDMEYIESDYKTFLMKYTPDFQEIWSLDLAEVFTEENSYIQNMIIGGENKVYLSSNNVIYVIDRDGNFVKTISVNANWINGLTATSDGRVFVVQYGNSGMEIVEIDTVKDVMGETLQGIPDSNSEIKAGRDGTLLVAGYNKLYEYDLNTQEATEVLDWVEANIHGNSIRDISILEDGRLVVYCDDYEGTPEIVFLTKTERAKVPQKKILTIATLYENNSSLQESVVNFNKKNTEYALKIKAYISDNVEWTESTYTDALTSLHADLAGGDCPDLIDLSMVNLRDVTAKGVLEDLTPYLKSSEVANIDDFVPSVLNAYNIDGIQTTVPTYFTIDTLLARTSVVGEETGWTMEEMIALAKANPDKQLLHGMTKERALQTCLMYASDSFIDYESGRCSFDSPEFIQFLEFANCFDLEYEYNENESFPKMLQLGKVLLSNASFNDVHAYQMYYLMFEEDGVTPIGYPTADGTPGVFLLGNEIYGISAQSENKESAWKFLESMLSGQSTSYGWGFSSRKEQLEEMFKEACEPEYQKDENGEIRMDEEGNPMQNPKTSWGYDNWNVDIYAATQEEIDGIRHLIEIARPLSGESEEIYSIIGEEAAPYFAGQKSAEEVAKIIQSRLQIYVSENR